MHLAAIAQMLNFYSSLFLSVIFGSLMFTGVAIVISEGNKGLQSLCSTSLWKRRMKRKLVMESYPKVHLDNERFQARNHYKQVGQYEENFSY